MLLLSRLASPSSLPRVLVVAVVVVFLLVQVPLLLAPPWRPVSVRLSDVAAAPVGAGVSVSGSLTAFSSQSPVDVHVVVIGLSWPSRPSPVYVYYDPAYPMIGTIAAMNGLADHLASDLAARGLPSTIHVLDAPQLAAFLRANTSGALILATTALPDNVFSWSVDLLTPWIRGGGTLLWLGELIGGFTVTSGVAAVTWNSSLNLQWNGERRFFGSALVYGAFAAGATAALPSPSAGALGLHFAFDSYGAQADLLRQLGGLTLGWVGTGVLNAPQPVTSTKTSIAAIHVGNGTVVLFGGTPASPPLTPSGLQGVSHDIAQILASGVAYTDYNLRDFSSWTYRLGAGETRTFTWGTTLPAPAGAVSVFAFIDPCAGPDLSQCFIGSSAFALQNVAVG